MAIGVVDSGVILLIVRLLEAGAWRWPLVIVVAEPSKPYPEDLPCSCASVLARSVEARQLIIWSRDSGLANSYPFKRAVIDGT
jgi:hypothetical protein